MACVSFDGLTVAMYATMSIACSEKRNKYVAKKETMCQKENARRMDRTGDRAKRALERRHKNMLMPLYTMPECFATETIALSSEKAQNFASARMFPAKRSATRSKAKVFLQGCPLAPVHRVHDLEAVARRQSRRDSHGGNFAQKWDFLPLEWQYSLRDNRSIKPELRNTPILLNSPYLKGLRHTDLSGVRQIG